MRWAVSCGHCLVVPFVVKGIMSRFKAQLHSLLQKCKVGTGSNSTGVVQGAVIEQTALRFLIEISGCRLFLELGARPGGPPFCSRR